jgi:hypothetical protein
MKTIVNIKRSIFFLALIILLISSCKKYEDGPSISLRSKKDRVANTWRFEKKYKNGVEESLSSSDQQSRWTFNKDGGLTYIYTSGSISYTALGNWDFVEDKNSIQTTLNYNYGFATSTEVTTYSILKLKEKELWLKEIKSNGDVYEYHYVEA